MSFSDYLETKVLDHVFGGTPYSAPANLYLALFTTTPNDSTAGTEVSGGSYARQVVTFTVSGSAPTQALSDLAIEFPEATASWGTITHGAVYDALTGGNMLCYAQLTQSDFATANPKAIGIGDIVRVPAGGAKVTLD